MRNADTDSSLADSCASEPMELTWREPRARFVVGIEGRFGAAAAVSTDAQVGVGIV